MDFSSAVATDSQVIKLVVRKEFEQELPPLDSERREALVNSIQRDGVLDSIKYRVTKDGVCEIIDGHNRFGIANELGLPYRTEQVYFKTDSVTNVLYWIHVFNAARRGSVPNTERMRELWRKLMKEQGIAVSETQTVKQVAKDADVSERTVWRNKSDKPKPVVDKLEYAIKALVKLLKDLDQDQKGKLLQIVQDSIGAERPGD